MTVTERGVLPGAGLISVSAYSAEVEPWRITRLHQTLGYLGAKGLGDTRIAAVHDHKGILTVTWLSTPHEREREAVKDAWGWQFEYEIEHKLL